MATPYKQPGREAIIKPRSVIITTRYFWRKWRPLLGNDLAVLIIEARQKCYRNNNTGEVRDWFYSTLDELAQTVGFSAKKISRLLKSNHAEDFIRFKPTYIYNPELEKRVKGKCLFKIALDDPLTPDDEMQLMRQDIHKDVSFNEQPNNQNEVKAAPLIAQPTDHDVRIKYSTFEIIKESKVIVSNHTRSGKGEQPVEIKLGRTNGDESDKIFEALLNAMRQESVFAQGILSQCSITEVIKNKSETTFVIDTPNRICKAWLERNYSRSIKKILRSQHREEVQLEFVLRTIK